MKKLANLIALFILVSVNVFTPITYAQGEWARNYDCAPEQGQEWWWYYICQAEDGWDYSCEDFWDWYWECEYNEDTKSCWDYGDGIIGCNVGSYQKSEQQPDWWYNFEPIWGDREFDCGYAKVWGLGLSSDLRNTSSYGDFVCSRDWEDEGEHYYGCSESLNGYYCPQLYSHYIDRDKGTYIFYKDTDNWYYSCDLDDFESDYQEDTSVVEGWDNYICWDQGWYVNSCYEDFISLPSSEPRFSEDDYELWYVCPISYSCYEEEESDYQEEGIYCYEKMSGEYECESNWPVVAKWLLSDIGGYSCSSRVNKYSCDWDESYWRFKCEEPSTVKYTCTFDGKDGYECTEHDEGSYKCVYPDSLIESSVYDNVVCYYGDIYHWDCSPIDDGYFCPVKWWTVINDNWDYECLEYNGPSGNGGGVIQNNWRYVAEYNEELGQCVYTVPGYDGNNIIIMSSNLGVTGGNLTWLYYQWWTWYGFPGYDGDTGGEESVDYQLSDEDMAIFDDYPIDEFLVWPTGTDPCPEHFHVPSSTEWNNLLISWCEDTAECDAAELTKHDSLVNHWALNDVSEENGYAWNYRFEDEVYSFMEDLNFLRWGSLDGYHANMLGLMGDYWAKEFIKTDKNWNKSSWWFTVYPRWWLGPVPFISNHAASVRCFADIEDDVEVSTPVALDLYIWWCGDSDFIAPTSAIEVLDDILSCPDDGYLWRKFVASGEAVNSGELNSFLPEWYQWVWYLDDYQTTKFTDNTSFTEDTRLYAFEEIPTIISTVTKVRNDADNQDWIRPTSVTVHLYSQSSLLMDTNKNLVTTKVLSEGNSWRATVNDLPQYPNTNYFWEEEAVPWYESSENTSSQDSSWFITTITNTHTPAVVTKYTVTFNSNGGSAINPVEVVEGQPVNRPNPNPRRNGYTFDGWYTDSELTNEYIFAEPVTWHLTLYAKWTENKPSWWNSGWYSGWGGWHSKWWGGNKSDVESVENEPSTPVKEENKSDPKPVVTWKWANSTGKVNSNQELFDAYEWAYANGLTKYGNMSDARMDDLLNRQEMAKITTIFASKFKNNTPNEAKRDFCSQYPDLWKTTEDMQEYIIQSCELGYMWYRANGIDALDRFRPYTPVSVAEVSIILSRIMWQNKYAISENLWYQWHLHAVYENNLLDNITKPFDYIARKDAYIMLYRISKTL